MELETKLDYYTRGFPNIDVFSDCSALTSLFSKGIDEIKNCRLQRMGVKAMGYSIRVIPCPGETNKVAEYLSRNPSVSYTAPDFEIQDPFLSSRSFRVVANSSDVRDPMLTRVVSAGIQDKVYSTMLYSLSVEIEET